MEEFVVLEGGVTMPPIFPVTPMRVGQADFQVKPLLLLERQAGKLPDLTVENMRNWDRPSLIRALVRKAQADPSWAPTAEEAEGLLCVM